MARIKGYSAEGGSTISTRPAMQGDLARASVQPGKTTRAPAPQTPSAPRSRSRPAASYADGENEG
jgi:hypothetical protein